MNKIDSKSLGTGFILSFLPAGLIGGLISSIIFGIDLMTSITLSMIIYILGGFLLGLWVSNSPNTVTNAQESKPFRHGFSMLLRLGFQEKIMNEKNKASQDDKADSQKSKTDLHKSHGESK